MPWLVWASTTVAGPPVVATGNVEGVPVSLTIFSSLFLWHISHIGAMCFGKSNVYGSTIHTECISWPICNSFVGEVFVPISRCFLCLPTCVCVGVASLSRWLCSQIAALALLGLLFPVRRLSPLCLPLLRLTRGLNQHPHPAELIDQSITTKSNRQKL